MTIEGDGFEEALEQCRNKSSNASKNSCFKKVHRQYRFSKLFFDEIRKLNDPVHIIQSFTIKWSTDWHVVWMYDDYEGFGLTSIGIPIGSLSDSEYDELENDDWIFDSQKSIAEISIDPNTSHLKTQLTGCINRAMKKARIQML